MEDLVSISDANCADVAAEPLCPGAQSTFVVRRYLWKKPSLLASRAAAFINELHETVPQQFGGAAEWCGPIRVSSMIYCGSRPL
jgi:hypothetical protein